MAGPVTALVQGASRGLGLQFCRSLLSRQQPTSVIATCRSPSDAVELRQLQQDPSTGSRLHVLQMDVTDEVQIKAAADFVRDHQGGLDLLINCAGILHPSGRGETSLKDVTLQGLQTTCATNAFGPLLMGKHFGPLLSRGQGQFGLQSADHKQKHKGVMVNISAKVGSITDNGLGGWYAYRMSKAALNMATKNLSLELGRSRDGRVLCVALHPGTVDTALSRPYHRGVPNLFSAEQSVTKLLAVVEGLTVEDTGLFVPYLEQAGTVQQTGLDSKKGIDPVNNANDDVNDDLNDDEDEGNWGSGYDDDEDSDEDGYTAESRRLAERRQRQARRRQQQVLLPTLLRYLARDQDVMVLLRAMLCQAVRFHSNSAARGAITNKVLLDLQDGHEVRVTTLVSSHGFLEEHMDTVRRGMLEKVMWQQANHCMLHATTTWAFVGYLMNIHHSRLEGFSDLVDLFFSSKDGDFTPPCLQDKVHILLTGKYQDIAVLDNGNQWLPEKKMADKFKILIGVEAWGVFELELRSNVQIHVYRESDIPNRHSHCNSNPYIPNVLRQKLGMKMLPEPKPGSRRTKRRR